MSRASYFRGFVFRRASQIGAGILAITVLSFASLSHKAETSRQPVLFALQGTATPAHTPTPTEGLDPSTTVTATPGAPVPPPGPGTYFSIALVVLLVAGGLAGALLLFFTRPGVWNGRNARTFSTGFTGWFIFNTLLWLWVNASVAGSSGTLFINPVVIVPLLVNFVALLVLLLYRRWMVILGVFSAIMINVMGTLLATPVTASYQEEVIVAIIFNVPFYLPPFLTALNIGSPG